MLHELSLSPSAALQINRFNDIDQFRQAIRLANVRFTPTVSSIDVDQVNLFLPGCDLHFTTTFPRVIDIQATEGTTMVVFPAENAFPVIFNGWLENLPMFWMGHDGAAFKAVALAASRCWAIVFHSQVTDRGWPDNDTRLGIQMISQNTCTKLRNVLTAAFQVASETGGAIAAPSMARSVEESILAAMDDALQSANSNDSFRTGTYARHFDIVHKIDVYLHDNLNRAMYSSDLAKSIGVSVRTMDSAIRQFRGMSLHRYLRLKRLWSTRLALLMGASSVKSCALDNGFWHMGDFSAAYRSMYGELPSQTLARAQIRTGMLS